LEYRGIKQAYPRLPKRLAIYIALMRPLTLVAALIGGFCMTITYYKLFGLPIDWTCAVLMGLVYGLLQASGQAMNQAVKEEVLIDIENKKTYRPVPAGLISMDSAKVFSMQLAIVGLILAFMIDLKVLLGSLALLVFAYGYTIPPLRIKRYVFSPIWISVSRGFLPVFIPSLLFEPSVFALLYGLVVMVWTCGAQVTKDMGDVEGDRKFGIKTIPIVLGYEGAVVYITLMMGLSFVLLGAFLVLGLMPQMFWWLMLLLVPSTMISICLGKGYRLEKFENNLSWIIYYLTLGCWFVLPVIII